jgi:hypothetical protein
LWQRLPFGLHVATPAELRALALGVLTVGLLMLSRGARAETISSITWPKTTPSSLRRQTRGTS